MDLVTFLWIEHSLLVMDTEPLVLPGPLILCRYMYQTSALYENLGTTMVLYSCFVPAVKSLLADFLLCAEYNKSNNAKHLF